MKITCQDRERILLDGSGEEWAALEQHAASCSECAEELRGWKALSVAAEEMRDYRDDPALWARIERSLRAQEQRRAARWRFWERVSFWKEIPLGWQTALAGALVLALALAGGYVLWHPNPPESGQSKLLKNSALAEVERTESEYMKAIDKLTAEARPQLDSPTSALMASYREKLMVLDSAIDELRVEAGRNPSNAHLRYELLAMYQEKQETLREVLETKP
ncbi:MAG TPA: hypothetical protein VED66_16465 [Candidatus Sulfotelmatobacter sp.]|nr:hypothetical protein [Candidatus Sulfotelmatobacter sp.]